MVTVKPKVGADDFKPLPKYGHLSELNPGFAPLKDFVDQQTAQLWSLPIDDFKAGWLAMPLTLSEGCPAVGKDITIDNMKVPVRDGTEVEIRIYKPIKPVPNALLNLNIHGGGQLFAFQ